MIISNKATLEALDTILSVEDMFDLLEIIAVEAHNKVTAQKFYDTER